MAKKKKRKQAEEGEVPMSAMIDVVFLLLIFFIVTHKEELVEAHLAINLPSPSAKPSGPPPPKPQLLEIQVPPDETHPDTYLLMGSKNVTLDVIEETLAGIAALDPDQTVIVKMSPEARQAKLVSLLDRCKKVGLSKLNVLTLKF